MPTTPPNTRRLPVTPGQVHRLAPSATLTCNRGTLWVTQAGDSTDHLLQPGDRFTPRPHAGRVLVQALSQNAFATVTCASAPASRPLARFFPTFNVVWRTVFSR